MIKPGEFLRLFALIFGGLLAAGALLWLALDLVRLQHLAAPATLSTTFPAEAGGRRSPHTNQPAGAQEQPVSSTVALGIDAIAAPLGNDGVRPSDTVQFSSPAPKLPAGCKGGAV